MIGPARDGTLRVLRAARDAGVRRDAANSGCRPEQDLTNLITGPVDAGANANDGGAPNGSATDPSAGGGATGGSPGGGSEGGDA